jgi:hypothetical protein
MKLEGPQDWEMECLYWTSHEAADQKKIKGSVTYP